MTQRLLRIAALTALAGAVLALSGCAGENRDLQQYIDQVKSRPGSRIEPLPTIRPAPSFAYEAGTRRSPFMPDEPVNAPNPNRNATIGPDPNRPREFLEQFPLDSLRMVGSLEMKNVKHGLVQGSDGLVHRVVIGNHMGQNYGQVMAITDSEIELMEIIPDGLGGYINREASIGLSD